MGIIDNGVYGFEKAIVLEELNILKNARNKKIKEARKKEVSEMNYKQLV